MAIALATPQLRERTGPTALPAGLLIRLAVIFVITMMGFAQVAWGRQPSPKESPAMINSPPDINGPGKVLRAGNLHMKVTNFGFVGNPFTNLSSDPSGQWPGDSGIEYLNSIRLAVGALDPYAVDPSQVHRVSYLFEWRPPSLNPEDRIYESHDGVVNGARFVNDDGDVDPITRVQRVDEDFLDGRDNDGDGLIDEDHGALGDQMFSLVMRDDTAEARNADPSYVPLGLECRQLAWAYSLPGFADFDVVEYTIYNRSGHTLDSVYVGWAADMDVGPTANSSYFTDDLDLPGFPSGEFTLVVTASDKRRQFPHAPDLVPPVSPDSALCPRLTLRVNGFAVSDNDGDGGQTPGVAAFLLIDHTLDPLGLSGPERVGFRAFRSFTSGTPFDHGGNPTTDAQRYAFMSSTENVDPATGFVSAAPGAAPGDYMEWCSIGPFLHLADGGSVKATIAFAVQKGDHSTMLQYPTDNQNYKDGLLSPQALLAKYPLLRVALDAQGAFEGAVEVNSAYPATDLHGRETPIRLPPGTPAVYLSDCHDDAAGSPRLVTDRETTWFDFDCNYCTGVLDFPTHTGLFHRTWVVPANLRVAVPGPEPLGFRCSIAPNPVRDRARFEIDLPQASRVRVVVYDLAGRRVRELSQSTPFSAGRHAVSWDLSDRAARRVRPGLYFYRVTAGSREQLGRLVVTE